MAKNAAELFNRFSDSHGLFSRMSAEQKESLASLGVVKTIPSGKLFIGIGDQVPGIYLINSGGFRLETISQDGTRFIVGNMYEGDVFGFLAVFDQSPAVHNISTLEDSECFFIPAEKFRHFVYSNQELMRWMIETLCQRLRMSLVSTARFAPGNITTRVARCLSANIARKPDGSKINKPIILKITQFDLASMLSVSRQTINGALKELEADKVIEIGYNQIGILDRESLWARTNP